VPRARSACDPKLPRTRSASHCSGGAGSAISMNSRKRNSERALNPASGSSAWGSRASSGIPAVASFFKNWFPISTNLDATWRYRFSPSSARTATTASHGDARFPVPCASDVAGTWDQQCAAPNPMRLRIPARPQVRPWQEMLSGDQGTDRRCFVALP
jgi:hypothetical protein